MSDFAQNFEICMRKLKNLCILTFFTVFFFIFHTHLVICDIFPLFLAQNFKTKVLTAEEEEEEEEEEEKEKKKEDY